MDYEIIIPILIVIGLCASAIFYKKVSVDKKIKVEDYETEILIALQLANTAISNETGKKIIEIAKITINNIVLLDKSENNAEKQKTAVGELSNALFKELGLKLSPDIIKNLVYIMFKYLK